MTETIDTPGSAHIVPDYVHDLIDALICRSPLDFHHHAVPEEVRTRILRRTPRPIPATAQPPALTDREFQVLRGMAAGLHNAEIGDRLRISEETVKTHARRLFNKIGARDRAHAVARGFRTGLLL